MASKTSSVIIDTDCLSIFIAVKRHTLLSQLFKGALMIPEQVKFEISRRKDLVPHMEKMISQGILQVVEITDPEDMLLYTEMLNGIPSQRIPAIGKGEAAVLIIAKRGNGIVVSNNKRDVDFYLKLYDLQWLNSGAILQKAIDEKLISQKTANGIWSDFCRTDSKIPQMKFPDYQKKFLQKE